jgi:hypothetical protein
MAQREQQVNGRYRNYSSIRANIFGRTLVGMTSISYKRMDSIDPVKAVGTSKPIGYTQGDERYEGSVTLLTEELDAIQASLPPLTSLPDIAPFVISVSYVDGNNLQVSHLLVGCKFKENGRSGDSGSTDALSQEIPLYIHNIIWNA